VKVVSYVEQALRPDAAINGSKLNQQPLLYLLPKVVLTFGHAAVNIGKGLHPVIW
jgi:hypothetical protein